MGNKRLTTLTLLLIFINHLQKKLRIDNLVKLADYICSEVRGELSFNIIVPDRKSVIEALYAGQSFDMNGHNESTRNIYERYQELETLFPEQLKQEHAILMFVDWFLYNVDLVEIIAYSDEEAYSIFEAMNDRGLKLNQTEMLKGYLLTNIDGDEKKFEANQLWKDRIVELMSIHKDDEADFFKHWLRSKYAKTVRAGSKGATNQDYEKIGNEYHKWVRDKKNEVGLKRSKDYQYFVNNLFDKYSNLYIIIRKLAQKYTPGFESIYYNAHNNFTLQYQLMLAPIIPEDDEITINKKIKLVSTYIDYYIAHRAVNYLTLSYASQKYTMAIRMMEMRDMSVEQLASYLKEKALEIAGYFDGLPDRSRLGVLAFGLNQWSKRYIRYILARLTVYVETQSGMEDRFVSYVSPYIKKPFEIEHIWADHFDRHKDEFINQGDFNDIRNLIGDLVLVPKGINQSLNDMDYAEKIIYYIKENLLTQSLHKQAYERNPGFISFVQRSGLPFRPHEEFKKDDILTRTKLYKQICEQIWSIDRLDEIANND